MEPKNIAIAAAVVLAVGLSAEGVKVVYDAKQEAKRVQTPLWGQPEDGGMSCLHMTKAGPKWEGYGAVFPRSEAVGDCATEAPDDTPFTPGAMEVQVEVLPEGGGKLGGGMVGVEVAAPVDAAPEDEAAKAAQMDTWRVEAQTP